MSGFLDKTGLAHLWEKMKSALSDKQDKLTAGDNITITDDGRISASGGGGSKNVFFGTCDTKSATYDKVVTCDDWTWEEGNVLCVHFTNGNRATGARLVIGTHEAVTVYLYGNVNGVRDAWTAGEVVQFVYTGGRFYTVSKLRATRTSYGMVRLRDDVNLDSSDYVATSFAVKTAYDLANGKQDKLTAGTGITIQDNVISSDGNSPTFYTVVGSSSSGFSFEDYLIVEKHDFSKGTITSAGSGYFTLALTNMKFTGIEGGTYYTEIKFETTLFGTACTINVPARVTLSVVNSDVASVDITLLAGLWTFETAQSSICYQALKPYDSQWTGQEFSCTEV